MTRARHNYKRRILGLSLILFLAAFITYLKHNSAETVDAASLANFDPGYIISDYVMSNKNSMTEAEIQAFLTKKNPCKNRDYDYYLYLSQKPNYTWHWKDDHFVCISEELFGDGEIIGEGETAAHIIWQAAQDFDINPQVLLVLLEKEMSLITDPIPNDKDYRKATGYGCPDTAACSSKYYGFKNQIRNAAQLFHTVLDGGWTNYPLGENYIQYNPSASCGGSVVNIRSLATSALYRYTPYQPNQGALNAGYGTAACGAYGNRNFYLYFEDWFGGITETKATVSEYKEMVVPRLLSVKTNARYIDTKESNIKEEQKQNFKFFSNLSYYGEELCLATEAEGNCYLYSDLEEVEIGDIEDMAQARMLIVASKTNTFEFETKNFSEKPITEEKVIFTKKTYVNNELCLLSENSEDKNCILYANLTELPTPTIKSMVVPRSLYVKAGSIKIDIATGLSEKITKEEKSFYNNAGSWFGELCLQKEEDNNTNWCILYDDLLESKDEDVEAMQVARFVSINAGARVVNVTTGNTGAVKENTVKYFDKKTTFNDKLCLQSIDKTITGEGQCVLYDDLREVENFDEMAIPRTINVVEGAKYYDVASKKYDGAIKEEELFFVKKIYINNGKDLCLATNEDMKDGSYRCVKYADLTE